VTALIAALLQVIYTVFIKERGYPTSRVIRSWVLVVVFGCMAALCITSAFTG
jgi:hypothetical protein